MERYCSTDLTNNNVRFIPYSGPLSCLKYGRPISDPCMSRVGETTSLFRELAVGETTVNLHV